MSVFLASLSWADLQRLREVVWRVHFRHVPGVPFDARQADMLIEALGPEVMERLLRERLDEG